VVRVDSQGIKTQGDNNNLIDPWVLHPVHIQGRIAYARRGGRRWRVAGGFLGRLSATRVRTIRLLDSGISALLRPAYQWMARNAVFRGLAHRMPAIRTISFDRPDGRELQLLLRLRVIGWLRPGMAKWHIRRPFRIFVDEASLPQSLQSDRCDTAANRNVEMELAPATRLPLFLTIPWPFGP
jgi:hypothetical protein